MNIMEFRIKQAELWREDVRDITGLTSVKMDTYLLVNAVQLGFCVMAFCEGRLPAGTPPWLICCHTLSLTGAFMYLLMSLWLAMHASVAAKSYEVRLLTQLVRLPVPSWAQLEGTRTYASTFEKLEARQMFRVPFAMGSQESVLSSTMRIPGRGEAGNSATAIPSSTPEMMRDPLARDRSFEGKRLCIDDPPSADPWGLEGWGDRIYELDGSARADPRTLQHIQLVRAAMAYWQSYDGFARVSMSIGTNQLVTALSYYVIGYVLVSNHAVVAAYLALVLFMAIMIAIIRLDMSLTVNEFRVATLLVVFGPICICASAKMWMLQSDLGKNIARVLVPASYAVHAAWMAMVLKISKVHEQKAGVWLPTGFRSVLYVDVFGWIRRNLANQHRWWDFATPSSSTAAVPMDTVSVNGPAVQAVRYHGGRPVPQRPETLPGASVPAPLAEKFPKGDFEPSTFVPQQRENTSGGEDVEQPDEEEAIRTKAGSRPWHVFYGATLLLFFLWAISGVVMTMQLCGWDSLTVVHLLRQLEREEVQKAVTVGHAKLVQNIERIGPGKLVLATWPSTNIHPHGLACDGDIIMSSTRFGLFAARLRRSGPRLSGRSGGGISSLPHRVSFETVPLCDDIEGESLQDVGLLCSGSVGDFALGSCQALVLHNQGKRLGVCNVATAKSGGFEVTAQNGRLSRSSSLTRSTSNSMEMDVPAKEASASRTVRSFLQRSTRLQSAWLGDLDEDGEPLESAVAVAPAPRCNAANAGAANGTAARACAYMGTTARRIVEMEESSASIVGMEARGAQWVPSRLLREARVAPTSSGDVVNGGALHDILGRYLGVLQADSEHLTILDPSMGGKVVGTWSLPPDQGWHAMCAAGDHIYLLAKGPSPQLWRFDVPAILLPTLSAAQASSYGQIHHADTNTTGQQGRICRRGCSLSPAFATTKVLATRTGSLRLDAGGTWQHRQEQSA